MKKILALILALVMIVALVGCNKKNPNLPDEVGEKAVIVTTSDNGWGNEKGTVDAGDDEAEDAAAEAENGLEKDAIKNGEENP